MKLLSLLSLFGALVSASVSLADEPNAPEAGNNKYLKRCQRGWTLLINRELLTNGLATATWMRTNLGLTTAIGKTPRGTVPTAIGSYDWSDLAADLTSRESTFGELRLLLVTPDHETGWNYDRRATLPRCWTEKRQIAQC